MKRKIRLAERLFLYTYCHFLSPPIFSSSCIFTFFFPFKPTIYIIREEDTTSSKIVPPHLLAFSFPSYLISLLHFHLFLSPQPHNLHLFSPLFWPFIPSSASSFFFFTTATKKGNSKPGARTSTESYYRSEELLKIWDDRDTYSTEEANQITGDTERGIERRNCSISIQENSTENLNLSGPNYRPLRPLKVWMIGTRAILRTQTKEQATK